MNIKIISSNQTAESLKLPRAKTYKNIKIAIEIEDLLNCLQ